MHEIFRERERVTALEALPARLPLQNYGAKSAIGIDALWLPERDCVDCDRAPATQKDIDRDVFRRIRQGKRIWKGWLGW